MKKATIQSQDIKAPAAHLIKRFPFLLGGNVSFRNKQGREKLSFLESGSKENGKNLISFVPESPKRKDEFAVSINAPRNKKVVLIKIEIRFPSGKTENADWYPGEKNTGIHLLLKGFVSADAGDLYSHARVYFSDGTVQSGAIKTLVLSKNPDQLVIYPKTYLISGRAGKVEYDWAAQEFHCRANATVTNGSAVSRTYTRCSVRVTDGGENGTLIDAFSFATSFTVPAGGAGYRVIDTRFPKGSNTWDKFNSTLSQQFC